MAGPSRQPDIIEEEEKYSFRLIKIGYSTSPMVLADIFHWGSSKRPNQTLKDFLLNTKKMSNTKYKKNFNKNQRDKMEQCTDVTTFDVSHLFRIIMFGCENLAPDNDPKWTTQDVTQLEWLVTAIKDQRNDVSHSRLGIRKKDFMKRLDDIREILEKAMEVAGHLYNQNQIVVDEKIKHIKEDIKSIRDQPLAQVDISLYDQNLLHGQLKQKVLNQGRKEIEVIYVTWSNVNPVSFLEGEKLLLKVSIIFTRIEVEEAGQQAKGSLVPYEDIIFFCSSNALAASGSASSTTGTANEIFLIEGPGGVGKTTLAKQFMDQWCKCKGQRTIKGLDAFDLLLFMECRNRNIKTFSELLCHLMPKTAANHFKVGDLLKCVLDLKLLLLIDGLDELNSASTELLKDILEKQKTSDLVIIVTSRPEKIGFFYHVVPPEFKKAHLRIIGIGDAWKEELLRRYHDELRRQGFSTQTTEGLIDYLRNSAFCLQAHFKLPLNLVLLAWLWSRDPARVTRITTATELYSQLFELVQRKLLERLLHNEATENFDEDELLKKISKFLQALYRESLIALREDSIEKILPSSFNILEGICNAERLPQKETISAFLVLKTVGNEKQASIPHKLIHDFYAAQNVMFQLFDQATQEENNRIFQNLSAYLNTLGADGASPAILNLLTDTWRNHGATLATTQRIGSIRDILTNLHKDNPSSLQMDKYRSMLVQLAGLLYLQTTHQVEESTAHEVVDLLKESGIGYTIGSAGIGIGSDDYWYDVIENTKCNDVIIDRIATYIHHSIDVTDPHVEIAVKLLNNARPKNVYVKLKGDPRTYPKFEKLLNNISQCGCEVKIYLEHDYHHPGTTIPYDASLQQVFRSCKVIGVMGQLSGPSLSYLSGSFVSLHLAVGTDAQAADVLPSLQAAVSGSLHISSLYVHISRRVSPTAVCPLPNLETDLNSGVTLMLSDLEDGNIEWAVQMAKGLQPSVGFIQISFPRAKITDPAHWQTLLERLGEEGVTMESNFLGCLSESSAGGTIQLPVSLPFTQEQLEDLEEVAMKHMGCEILRQGEGIKGI